MKISSGKKNRPIKCVIYGPEGIGKTTLASQFPDPLFIDTEGGTSQIDVNRVEDVSRWSEMVYVVEEIAAGDFCKTLVIDTADWAEKMCIQQVCSENKQKSIESFGYGKGYTYLSEKWSELMTACNKVIDSGKNVVITAHAKMRKQELPDEAGAFDRWEMKLSKNVAPIVKEWADLLLFLNYKTYVVQSGEGFNRSNKASGGKRVMYASHHPCWDAKNRYGLPDEMDMDFANIAHLFKIPLERLNDMCIGAGISLNDVQAVAVKNGKQPEDVPIERYPNNFVDAWCIKYFSQIVDTVKEDKGNE